MSEKFVAVRFKHDYASAKFDSGAFTFRTTFDDLKPGDLVVCETRYGMSLGQVQSEPLELGDYDKINMSVVAKVDLTEYKERQKKEAEKTAILKEMRSLKSKLEERAIYEFMAKENPAMRSLLDKLNELEGVKVVPLVTSAPEPTTRG